MKKIRLSSFGLRGFAGDTLTPRAIIDFASAYATYIQGGKVVVGHDTRYSSPMVYSAMLSGLLNAGCDVIDLGICPTPFIQFAVRHYGAAGGLSASGGHNEAGWNSLILIDSDGGMLDPHSGQNVLDIFHSKDFTKKDWQGMGTITQSDTFKSAYFEAMQSFINVDAIRAAKLTVLADPLGGSGVPYMDAFAQCLGIHLIPINGNATGYLAREAEPRPRSAMQMASIIPHLKGDAGFLFCSDMVRMSLVTENSEPKSEEYTFALLAQHVLSKQKGCVVTNCCTSRMIDDIVAKYDGQLVKSKVGQSYVLTTLADEQGIIGGEGNGSVVIPNWGPSFDGFIMMALIIEAMVENKVTLSQLIDRLPSHYHIAKRNVPCESNLGYRAIEQIGKIWRADGHTTIDQQDGLRIDFEDHWIHVRNSRTENIVRIISEAKDKNTAEKEADKVIRVLENLV